MMIKIKSSALHVQKASFLSLRLTGAPDIVHQGAPEDSGGWKEGTQTGPVDPKESPGFLCVAHAPGVKRTGGEQRAQPGADRKLNTGVLGSHGGGHRVGRGPRKTGAYRGAEAGGGGMGPSVRRPSSARS